MLRNIDMEQSTVGPQRVVQRQRSVRSRKRVERDSGEAFREQVEVLGACSRDVCGRVELPDRAELLAREPGGDVGDDVVCGGIGPGAVRSIGPNEGKRAVEDISEARDRNRGAEAVLRDECQANVSGSREAESRMLSLRCWVC